MGSQDLIYSFKVRYGNGSGTATGRINGADYAEARDNLLKRFQGYGQLNVEMKLLKNQELARKQWNK